MGVGGRGPGRTAGAGCYHPKHDLTVPTVEEWKVAPDADQYNNPPEQGYTKPKPKKEFVPGVGAPGSPGGGQGGGMGGQGGQGLGGRR